MNVKRQIKWRNSFNSTYEKNCLRNRYSFLPITHIKFGIINLELIFHENLYMDVIAC